MKTSMSVAATVAICSLVSISISVAINYFAFRHSGPDLFQAAMVSSFLTPACIAPTVSYLFAKQSRNLIAAQAALAEMAFLDPLTKLHNRRVMYSSDHPAGVSVAENETCALLVVDVDHFKSVNDDFGHAEGDSVLVAVAETLRSCCRKGDIVVRAGGEEFYCFLPDADLQVGFCVAERIRKTIEARSFTVGLEAFHVSVSIGVGQAGAGIPVPQAIRDADKALFRAKKHGRNRCEIILDEAA